MTLRGAGARQRKPSYNVAGELMWLISEHTERLTGAVYIMWGGRDYAQALMRDAASEALNLPDFDAQLDAWAPGWVHRVRLDSELRRTYRA